MKTKQSIAHAIYEDIAEDYASMVETKDANALYEKPAMLSIMPEVKGKYVLDAGCGPGVYTEWLLEHGAKVLAIDYSQRMVDITKKRTKGKCEVKVADLSKPLDFIENSSLDLVLSPLVFDYVWDWKQLFQELHRILKNDGIVLFSVGHPCFAFEDYGTDNYFETELVKSVWGSGFKKKFEMQSVRRPLTEVISSVTDAGFLIENVHEPMPTEAIKNTDPEFYHKLLRKPLFMCIRARKIIPPRLKPDVNKPHR